jgi:hypothetical protein
MNKNSGKIKMETESVRIDLSLAKQEQFSYTKQDTHGKSPMSSRNTNLPPIANAFRISVSFLNTDIEAYVYNQDTFESLARRVSNITDNLTLT